MAKRYEYAHTHTRTHARTHARALTLLLLLHAHLDAVAGDLPLKRRRVHPLLDPLHAAVYGRHPRLHLSGSLDLKAAGSAIKGA